MATINEKHHTSAVHEVDDLIYAATSTTHGFPHLDTCGELVAHLFQAGYSFGHGLPPVIAMPQSSTLLAGSSPGVEVAGVSDDTRMLVGS